MMLRSVGAVVALVAFVAVGSAGATAQVYRPALFVTLPMTHGFADATDALVQALWTVRDALAVTDALRLVDRHEDSDAVLTVLGRGTGDAELNAALKDLRWDIIAPPVMIATNERYIEAMLTVGSCDESRDGSTDGASPACYRRIFVGLGLADRGASPSVRKAGSNSWEGCASALAKDVRAWLAQNAGRLLERRTTN